MLFTSPSHHPPTSEMNRFDHPQPSPSRSHLNSSGSPYRYPGSVPSLLAGSREFGPSSGPPPVEGRRRARLQSSAHSSSRDPTKRASHHEPLMSDALHRQSAPPIALQRAHLSTLAIPELLGGDSGPRIQRTTAEFMLNPANQNFILRKSKSVYGGAGEEMLSEVEPRRDDRSIDRKKKLYNSVDEGVDDDCEEEEVEDYSDEDKPSFPSYNHAMPTHHHHSTSSASTSWIGGLFSPKFTTITATTAAKSASLSFAQMKSLSGSGLSGYSPSSLYELEDAFDAKDGDRGQRKAWSRRASEQDIELETTSSARKDSISIPYTVEGSSLETSAGTSTTAHHPKDRKNSNLAYSSSSGCSTQSSASSSHSLSAHFARNNKSRSSLKEAAANFRDFVQVYERGLIECISSVEKEQQLMHNQLEAGGEDRLKHEEEVDDEVATNGGQSSLETEGVESSSKGKSPDASGQITSTSPDGQPEDQIAPTTPPKNGSLSPPTSPLLSHSLRLQLEKVRTLRDQYETGYRCSEALERLMKVSKKTRDCDREIRANERALAAIEAQLEAMIGTFRIKVEDLEGFARICPRDNYEIEFRHGKQRRVLRVRIGKALERIWEDGATGSGGSQEVEFRGALKPTIVCRVREVKSSWRVAWSKRTVTLGVTSISMSELLVAVFKGRQILLDANASGSLKLRIRCSWAPKNLLEESPGASLTSNRTTPEDEAANKSATSIVNQSFRSENLNFALKKSAAGSEELQDRKASTLNAFPAVVASTPSIPRASLPKSPKAGPSPSKTGPTSFSNLQHSADLSRSLLALPSFYYSTNQVNPLLSHLGSSRNSPGSPSPGPSTSSKVGPPAPSRNAGSTPRLAASSYSLGPRSTSPSSLCSEDLDERSSLESGSLDGGGHGHAEDHPCSSASSPSLTLSLEPNGSTQNGPNRKSDLTGGGLKKSTLKTKIESLTTDLTSLQCALEDYRGQYVELTMMSVTIGRLIDYYEEQIEVGVEMMMMEAGLEAEEVQEDVDSLTEDSLEVEHDQQELSSGSLVDEVNSALAEFDFLESVDVHSSSEKPTTSTPSTPKSKSRPPPPPSSPLSTKENLLDLWSSVLALHVHSSLEQLGHVGSWILKGREAAALARLRADAFAFELIYELLISGGRANPLGKDRRVLELWQFATERLTPSRHRPYILSWRQLCQLLIDLMVEYGFGHSGSGSGYHHLDDSLTDEDALRYAAEWLSGLIVPLNMTKVTLFDLRAFFELDLWRGGFKAGNGAQMMLRRDSLLRSAGGSGSQALPSQNTTTTAQSLSLKRLFAIALDVDRLMRKAKKISLHSLESILFDRFNVNALWIPSDVTLTLVGLLYEHHSTEKQSKLTTSEVKKLDRAREMAKMATNWIIWLLQDCRFEIREHVLSGLESSTAFTRRAACYGIQYMFKLMKRSTQYDPQSTRLAEHLPPPTSGAASRRGSSGSSGGVTFFGQELDSLLYVSMEDPDGRVREEAKKALKCLGHYGQQRLNQMERSRMGFVGGGGGASGPSKGPVQRRMQNAPAMLRCSMPNLNGI